MYQGQIMVVSQKRVNGREGRSSFAFFLSDVYLFFVQMAALFARHHPAKCAVVLSLRLILPGSRGDDAGARGGSRPFHDQSLGVEVRSGTWLCRKNL